MYLPRAFEETRAEALAALMRAAPLATLIASDRGRPLVEHVPLLLDDDGRLRGHVAAGNGLAQMDGVEILAVFHGADGYVSPNWYPGKRESGREVPTWNYAVVHVHGRLHVRREHDWLLDMLEALTRRHEYDQPQPWHLADAPAAYVERLLEAIVGVEIEAGRTLGKFKLSQNRPARDRLGVMDGLRRRGRDGDAALAALMAQGAGAHAP